MPYYAFTPPRKETQAEADTRTSNALTSAIGLYTQGKEKEEAQRRQEESLATIQNPNASDIQRAIAWGNINPKVQEQLMKQEQQQQKQALIERILGQDRVSQNTQELSTAPIDSQNMHIPSRIPNVNQLREQLGSMIPVTGATPPIVPRTEEKSTQMQDPFQQASEKRRQSQAVALLNEPALSARIGEEANALEKNALAQQKNIIQQEQFALKQRREDHKDSADYDKEIQKNAKVARHHLHSSDVARKAIMSGKINPKSFEGLARNLFKGTKWQNYFTNPETATFEAAALSDYEGMKDMFGTRLSDADLRAASGKIIDPAKSPEANLAIIDFRQLQDRMKIAEAEIGDQIKKENGGYRPIDYTSQVRKKMEELYGDEAEEIVKKAANEGEPTPEPNSMDPLMISTYGPVPQGKVRLKKGSEVIDIPIGLMDSALNDSFRLLEAGAQ
jgi:hypothetical protein